MNLAARDLRRNLGRFLLTTAGVALLVMIVMGMRGIYRGLVADALVLLDHSDADLWVVQRDTRGPLAEPSHVSRSLAHPRPRGSRSAVGPAKFIYHTAQRDVGRRNLRFDLLGLSWPDDRGQSLPIVAGRGLAQNHFEMVADRSLGFHQGQRIALGKESYTVVGLTEGLVGLEGNGIAAISVDDALVVQGYNVAESVRARPRPRVTPRPHRASWAANSRRWADPVGPSAGGATPGLELPRVNAVLVKVRDGWHAEEVAVTIRGWGDVTVHSRQTQRSLLVEGCDRQGTAGRSGCFPRC